MIIGFFQVRTAGGIFFMIIGFLNTVPSSMERMVPLGLFHCCLRLYSLTRAAFGVIVADIDLKKRLYQFRLYGMPDDSGHLISVHFDYWIIYSNRHRAPFFDLNRNKVAHFNGIANPCQLCSTFPDPDRRNGQE